MTNLDPEAVRRKRGSVVRDWMTYARADSLYDEWQAEAQEAALSRAVKGGGG